MLTPKMIERLNTQVSLELYSSLLYMQMSSWCEYKGFSGAAKFLYGHAQEELTHMRKLFDYINETGSMAVLSDISAPPSQFSSLKEVFEVTLEHEMKITAAINDLAGTALEEKDFSTFNFLQWYVAEQHEEEKTFRSIIDKLMMVEKSKTGDFLVDQELGRMRPPV